MGHAPLLLPAPLLTCTWPSTPQWGAGPGAVEAGPLARAIEVASGGAYAWPVCEAMAQVMMERVRDQGLDNAERAC